MLGPARSEFATDAMEIEMTDEERFDFDMRLKAVEMAVTMLFDWVRQDAPAIEGDLLAAVDKAIPEGAGSQGPIPQEVRTHLIALITGGRDAVT
jgi:hypothetical protein